MTGKKQAQGELKVELTVTGADGVKRTFALERKQVQTKSGTLRTLYTPAAGNPLFSAWGGIWESLPAKAPAKAK